MFHYKRHIGDYRSATAHLTNDEDLAYMRLLDYYYETEGPIDKPLDWLARRLRVKADDLSVVLADFFTKQDDGWHQKRCDEEISEYRSYCQKNSENGQKGGRPRKPTANRTVTDGLASETQSQPTRNPDESLTVNREPPTCEPPTPVQTPRATALGSSNKPPKLVEVAKPAGLSDALWNEWRAVRGKKLVTQLALDAITREAAKAGLTLDEAVALAAENGWQSFKADYIKTGSRGAPKRRSINDDICRPGFSNGADSVQEF